MTVTPRRPGDPKPEPLGLLLAHRAMLRDLNRVTALVAGHSRFAPKRAAAVAGYIDDLCDSIHHHHSAEDDILWPVLEESAGPHVDLTELTDDHAVLDPKLHRVRAGAAALRATGEVPAALAADMADIRDTLHEHIADEERTIVPLIREYMSVADWATVEEGVRGRGAKMSFEAPRVIAVATPAETQVMLAEGGLPLRVMVKVMPVMFRRRERKVFGTA
jgi:hemerythrin-like domain-containing protein